MCFCSQQRIEDLSLITSFHSCGDRKSVLRIAEQMGIIEVEPIWKESETQEKVENVEVVYLQRLLILFKYFAGSK